MTVYHLWGLYFYYFSSALQPLTTIVLRRAQQDTCFAYYQALLRNSRLYWVFIYLIKNVISPI